jgi:hypothetical protein
VDELQELHDIREDAWSDIERFGIRIGADMTRANQMLGIGSRNKAGYRAIYFRLREIASDINLSLEEDE